MGKKRVLLLLAAPPTMHSVSNGSGATDVKTAQKQCAKLLNDYWQAGCSANEVQCNMRTTHLGKSTTAAWLQAQAREIRERSWLSASPDATAAAAALLSLCPSLHVNVAVTRYAHFSDFHITLSHAIRALVAL